MAKLLTITTPDGIVHDDLCLITSELHILHGSQIVTNQSGQKERVFSFNAKVQAFHTQQTAEEGRMPILNAAFGASGQNLQYFQYAGMTLHDLGLTPEGASNEVASAFKGTKLADVVDAAVWYAVQKSNPERFAEAKPATLGNCVFTNPAVSRVVSK